jgi:superfamily I DNA/RNA helicase
LDVDRDTLQQEAYRHGPKPWLAWYSTRSSDQARAANLNQFLHSALRESRQGPGAAVVLFNSIAELQRILPFIDPRLAPLHVTGRRLDLDHPGVKLLPLQSAKGLEFPVVAVMGADRLLLTAGGHRALDAQERVEKGRRRLFMACTRSLGHLLVEMDKAILDKNQELFLYEIEREDWGQALSAD